MCLLLCYAYAEAQVIFDHLLLFLEEVQLSRSSDFHPQTTKPGNIGPRTGKTVRITPSITVASCFEGGFATVTFPNFWNFTPLN